MATTSVTSPQLGSPSHTNTKSFLLTSGIKCSGSLPCSEIFSLQCSSLHPALIPSVWVTMDWLVWAPNWKDSTSLPLHLRDTSLPPSPSSKQIHISFYSFWYFNHQHLSIWSLQRWPCYVIFHKRLFHQLFSCMDSRLLRSWAQVDTWEYLENCWENCWTNPPKFVHPPLADFHSFSSAAGGGRLASLMSSIYYSFFPILLRLILTSNVLSYHR